MLELPHKGQSFRIIREKNLLYVDKTEYIYNIIQNMGCVFLSRPRRFGKSLLLNAMAEVFRGERELFDGLWIGSSDYDFKRYPVLQLNMAVESRTADVLRDGIRVMLHDEAESYGMDIIDGPPGGQLMNLVRRLKTASGERVAVLVDEYDAPIQSKIGNPAEANEIRLVLHDFYSGLKTLADRDQLQILFVTGVAKFTQASIFSVFNILDDLTLHPKFNAVCGFTIEEFDAYFGDYLTDVLEHNKAKGYIPSSSTVEDLKGMIKEYYDGYSWDGVTRVFNPFSIVKFLSRKQFNDFWHSTGAPTSLHDFIREYPIEYISSETYPLSTDMLEAVDIEDIELVPLLFQAGYLTIKEEFDSQSYILKGPNIEVNRAFNVHLLAYLTGEKIHSVRRLASDIRNALISFDPDSLAEGFSKILRWVSHQQHKSLEGIRHAVIFAAMKALQFSVESEVSEADGTFDMKVFVRPGIVYICEFKLEKFQKKRNESDDAARDRLLSKALKRARKQIIDKGYDKRFYAEFKIVKRLAIGIVGSSTVGAELF
jgi:hypothetical protein